MINKSASRRLCGAVGRQAINYASIGCWTQWHAERLLPDRREAEDAGAHEFVGDGCVGAPAGELDAARGNSKYGSRQDDAQQQRLENSPNYGKALKAADALFTPGAPLPDAVAGQLDPDNKRQAQKDAMLRVTEAGDRKLWTERVVEYFTKYPDMPEDPYFLDSLLDHPKDRIVDKALLLTTPMASVCLGCPELVVRVLLGEGWEGAAPMLRALGLVMLMPSADPREATEAGPARRGACRVVGPIRQQWRCASSVSQWPRARGAGGEQQVSRDGRFAILFRRRAQ